MNRQGSFITGVALATMLGAGFTAAVPGLGLRTASAQIVADDYFRVDWSAQPDGHGSEKISGYVYNDWGMPADQVELRVVALDASGKQIGSFVEPLLDTVPAGDRVYFDVKVPGQAASYRVNVASYNFIEGEAGN